MLYLGIFFKLIFLLPSYIEMDIQLLLLEKHVIFVFKSDTDFVKSSSIHLFSIPASS